MAGYSLRKNWRGSVLGALVGITAEVNNPRLFHGHLSSPATIIGFALALLVPVSIGAYIESRVYRADRPPVPPTILGTAVYALCSTGCVALAAWTIYVKYPGGVGLLSATHADNAYEVAKVCIKARESKYGDSLKATKAFCSCVGEVVAARIDAGEMKGRPAADVIHDAAEACRKP